MAVATYDAVTDLVTMLTAEWSAGTAPIIRRVWDVKAVGLGSDNQEEIILTPLDEQVTYFSLYGTSHLHTIPILVDIRTFGTLTRHSTVVNEVSRIIKNNVRRSATGFVDVREMMSKSHNQEYRNMFRHTLDVVYRKHIVFP